MPLSTPFQVDGKSYVITRPLSVPDQMHIARKIGPFLPRIPRVMKALDVLRTDEERRQDPLPADSEPTPEDGTPGTPAGDFDPDDPKLNDVLSALDPLLNMASDMKEEDLNSIMVKCFRCVDRIGQGGVQPIWNNRANDFQFSGEMDIGVAAYICKEVIVSSIGPFLREKVSQFLDRHHRSNTLPSGSPKTGTSTLGQ